jgi:hypothetical protein
MSLWRRVYEERRRVMLPLVAFLVANVAIFALAVVPLRHSVAGNEADAQAATLRLAQTRLANKSATNARSRKEEADQELKKFYAQVLPDGQASSVKLVFFWVNQAARDAKVQLESSQTDEAVLHDSKLARVSCHFTLRGDYQDIRRFLYKLETAQQFVIVEKVELAQQGTTLANQNGALEVGLDVATYYFGGAR